MENLNDVEFGSDKSTEEAPILIAQRYLNIFRQIHIFNKDKRTQFDDELLALPQNILDFFTRLPGGRLLVEHIEDVKTERGISFVKSNKDDFKNQDVLADTPQSSEGRGGNVVMDSSFADVLAKSMASAFAQSSNQPISSAGNAGFDPSLLASLNKTFQFIAEEIKTSRASLLEVIQENQKMTASIISSQQATNRLLEKLSTGAIVGNSLACLANTSNEKPTINSVDILQQQHSIARGEKKLPTFENENSNVSDFQKKKKKKKHNQSNNSQIENFQQTASHNVNIAVHDTQRAQPDISVKSEKIAPVLSGVIRNITSKHEDDFKNINLDEPPLDDFSFGTSHQSNDFIQRPEQQFSSFHLKNSATDNIPQEKNVSPKQEENYDSTSYQPMNEFNSLMEGDGLDFALPEQGSVEDTEPEAEIAPVNGLDSLMENDGLDFALPEQGSVEDTEPEAEVAPVSGLDSLMGNDGLDFALPEQGSVEDTEPEAEIAPVNGLDSLMGGDGLDFALPEQGSVEDTEPEAEVAPVSGLDSLMEGDGLDFALPEQGSVEDTEPEAEVAPVSGLDSLMGNDGLDFALPEQGSVEDTEPEAEVAPVASGFDSLMNDNGLDSFLSNENTGIELPEKTQETQKNINTLDDFEVSAVATAEQSQPNTNSRYAMELNKIREALTSDDIDISSLDEPIALDDYSDDENVQEEDNDIFTSNTIEPKTPVNASAIETITPDSNPSEDEDWEWEYVDENGNPIEATDGDDEDWEWEYVEDDNTDDNNPK